MSSTLETWLNTAERDLNTGLSYFGLNTHPAGTIAGRGGPPGGVGPVQPGTSRTGILGKVGGFLASKSGVGLAGLAAGGISGFLLGRATGGKGRTKGGKRRRKAPAGFRERRYYPRRSERSEEPRRHHKRRRKGMTALQRKYFGKGHR